ncbi:hypothetical protein [Methanobrevibacter sp.]|uniref:hypothetical protein n=1 Tax=Methanobrevibacter sp. TaxID=66852 RepID=UPI00388ED166
MFDYEEYKLVGDLLAQIEMECYQRSAISRYYYALFNPVRSYLIFVLNEFDFIRGADFHKRICNRLMQSNDDTEKALGLILDELRQLRNDADYNWNLNSSYFEESLKDVKSNIELGFDYLNALRNSPPLEL